MGHTPFGYKIENGCAVVDEAAAGQIRQKRQGLFLSTEESAGCLKINIILEMDIIRQS